MAMAPTAAPAAAPPMEMPVEDMDVPAAPTVLMTVMDNHDGTVTLIMGDEPEEGPAEEMAEAGMAGMPGGPMPPPGAPGMAPPPAGAPGPMAGMPEEELAPVGDVYDSQTLGEMLQVIMQESDAAMAASGGPTAAGEEADMMASFEGAPV